MRAFVALDLPEELAEPVTRLQAGLTAGRAVPEENLHLTLAFLGEISDPQAMDLAEALAGIRAAPVALELKGLDMFGGRRPSVLAITASGEGLERLQKKVATAARAAGLTLSRERFRPHLSIARFSRDMGAKDRQRLGEFLALNGTFSLPPAMVRSFTLYRSHLRPEGVIHEPLAEFDLTG